MHISRDIVIIMAIIAVALLVRFVSFGYFSSLAASNPDAREYPVVVGDSEVYARLADNLLTSGAYQEVPGAPHRGWPPGYAALLAGVKALTGSMTPTIILQFAFAALALVIIYKMARTLMPLPYTALPPVVYALDPMVIFSDTTLATDGLFSALLVCTVYIAFFQSRLSGWLRWALVGVLVGLITMLRPIAEFLALVLPAFLLMGYWLYGRREDSSPARAVLACIIGFLVVVSPWMMRNYAHFGSFEISNIGELNLYVNHARSFLVWRDSLASSSSVPAFLVRRQADQAAYRDKLAEMDAELARITPEGEDPINYRGKLALRYILADPLSYAYFHAVNTTPFFLSSSIASYEQYIVQIGRSEDFYAPVSLRLINALKEMRAPEGAASLFAALRPIAPIVLEIGAWFVATALALFAFSQRRSEFIIVVFAVLIAYFAALTGPMSGSRYRIPAEPYLLTLAALGMYLAISWVQTVRARWRASQSRSS